MIMNKLLDIYYKRPLFYDILLTVILVACSIYLNENDFLNFSFDCDSKEVAGLGVTVSGFILTILSILISLKSNQNETSKKINYSPFEIFLASKLYGKSISVLKKGVIILLFVSFLTLSFSTLLKEQYCVYGLYFNITCLFLILLVFLRSFYLLNLIFKMQNKSSFE